MTYFEARSLYDRARVQQAGALAWRALPMTRVVTWGIRICGILLAGMALLYAAVLKRPAEAAIDGARAALFLLLSVRLAALNGWLAWAAVPKDRLENTISFREEGIVDHDSRKTTVRPYRQVRTLLETRDSFYVLLGWGKCLPMGKADFTVGDPGGLQGFLSGRCPKLRYQSFDIQIGGTT